MGLRAQWQCNIDSSIILAHSRRKRKSLSSCLGYTSSIFVHGSENSVNAEQKLIDILSSKYSSLLVAQTTQRDIKCMVHFKREPNVCWTQITWKKKNCTWQTESKEHLSSHDFFGETVFRKPRDIFERKIWFSRRKIGNLERNIGNWREIWNFQYKIEMKANGSFEREKTFLNKNWIFWIKSE